MLHTGHQRYANSRNQSLNDELTSHRFYKDEQTVTQTVSYKTFLRPQLISYCDKLGYLPHQLTSTLVLYLLGNGGIGLGINYSVLNEMKQYK